MSNNAEVGLYGRTLINGTNTTSTASHKFRILFWQFDFINTHHTLIDDNLLKTRYLKLINVSFIYKLI